MQVARKARVPVVIPAAIAIAWIVAVYAQFTGSAAFLHHHALIERGPPLWIALLLSICAWFVMIAAMMLPSSIAFFRMFTAASVNQPRHTLAFAAFTGGYVAIWCAFGIAAFLGDILLHRAVDRFAWLGAHPWMIAGGVLAAAGLF